MHLLWVTQYHNYMISSQWSQQAICWLLFFCCSVAKLCPNVCNPTDCSKPVFPVFHHPTEFAQAHVHWVGDASQSSHPLSPTSPALNLFQHQDLFQWIGFSHQVTKALELYFSISSPSEYSGLISFRIDWLNLDLACPRDSQESSLAPHFKGINSSALNLLYGPTITFTTRKNIALTIWTFVSKVMSLLFSILARCVIAFLPRSKHLLISCLQSPPAVILEHKKIKIFHCFHCFPHLFAMKW